MPRASVEDGARDREGKPAPMPVGARVRLRGTLTAPREIDGMPFAIDAQRIEGRLATGVSAELRGAVQADGSIRGDRLRTR